MSVKITTNEKRYIGLSTDTKPSDSTLPAGSTFHELNTGKQFVWDGAAWVDDLRLIYALSLI
jgi:hypothetical protein